MVTSINNLRYADDTTLMAESKEELKSLLMNMKEESEKAGLKLNIQKTKLMASSPITSWQTGGRKVETAADFILLRAAVHGVAKSRTRLSDFLFTFHFHALEKEMATHSNILAWKNPMDGGAC